MARILVVDDDARNLRLAVAVLESAGHEVVIAESGMQGVTMARVQVPDLVLMDIQMPGMDGVTALRRLRSERGTASLKVVALTALAMKGDAERLLAEGFDGYITKPVRYQTLLGEVARLLDEVVRSG